ncbi:MAG: HTTM domain-containing protein [Halobacteria archaeon]
MDVRALAVFRISFGVLLMADVLIRLDDLRVFYTDSGVLPRDTLFRYSSHPLVAYVPHSWSGEPVFQYLLFAITGFFAVLLILGYRTRVVTVVSFLLVFSLHVLNPLTLNSGDVLFRRLLFWSIFLPLGATYSYDCLFRNDDREKVSNFASACILLQVVLVYAVNALWKHRGSFWMDRNAVGQVLSLEKFSTSIGSFLVEYPTLTEFFTKSWMIMLTFSVLLLLLTGWSRVLFVFVFITAHLFMAATMKIGLFPYISVAALFLFLPPVFWSTAEKKVAALLPQRYTTVFSGGSELPGSKTSEIKRLAGKLTPLMAVFFAGLLLVNVVNLGYVELGDDTGEFLENFEAKWSMFAPRPPVQDYWMRIKGVTGSDVEIDPMGSKYYTNGTGPPDIYRDARWRKYLSNLDFGGRGPVENSTLEYFCRKPVRSMDLEPKHLVVYSVTNRTGSNTNLTFRNRDVYRCP